MTKERYVHWMRIWEWFRTVDRTPKLENLYELLNIMWHEERKASTPEELAAHSAAWALDDLDFAGDPGYQAYIRERECETGKS